MQKWLIQPDFYISKRTYRGVLVCSLLEPEYKVSYWSSIQRTGQKWLKAVFRHFICKNGWFFHNSISRERLVLETSIIAHFNQNMRFLFSVSIQPYVKIHQIILKQPYLQKKWLIQPDFYTFPSHTTLIEPKNMHNMFIWTYYLLLYYNI